MGGAGQHNNSPCIRIYHFRQQPVHKQKMTQMVRDELELEAIFLLELGNAIIPALQISMSMGVSRAVTSFAQATTLSKSDNSQATGVTLPLSLVRPLALFHVCGQHQSHGRRAWPTPAWSPRPSPELHPVTSAVLPVRSSPSVTSSAVERRLNGLRRGVFWAAMRSLQKYFGFVLATITVVIATCLLIPGFNVRVCVVYFGARPSRPIKRGKTP